MSHRTERLLTRMSLVVLGLMLLLSLLAGVLPPRSSAGWFALAMRSFVLTTGSVVAVGLAIGLPLGTLAASGPRPADGALASLCDLCTVLPAVFVLTVGKFATPGLLGILCVAGAVRGVGFAWVLRTELNRGFAREHDVVARNLGHGPLLVFFRERLPSALGPVLTSASLTGAWAVAIEAIAVRAGLGPLTSYASFGVALGRGERQLLITLAVALGTGALYVLARSASDRLVQGSESEPFALVRK